MDIQTKMLIIIWSAILALNVTSVRQINWEFDDNERRSC